MGLDVIGAGFGRTGTESMKRALEMIGYGPCYHMHEVLKHEDRVALWRKAAMGDLPDWDQAFAGFRATVDWPGAAFWRDLSAYYPDAKVILTVRSSESWFASMEKTILKVLKQSTDPNSIGLSLIANGAFGGNIDDRDHIIDVYENNISEVQAAIEPDRLLTYELGSGWEPLCSFLDCPVPDDPYPFGNEEGAFHSTLDRLQSERVGNKGKSE